MRLYSPPFTISMARRDMPPRTLRLLFVIVASISLDCAELDRGMVRAPSTGCWHLRPRDAVLRRQVWLARDCACHGIDAPSLRRESNLSCTTHAIEFSKHLIPREVGTFAHEIFEHAARFLTDHVQDLIGNLTHLVLL